ncbi:MAG: serine/threonine protein kinase [Deltaproteobacteria bacterium]|nr:serine/threonine protein kinase [Deltaproteobacteria bacterium]
MNDMLDRVFDRKYRITHLLGEGGMGTVYEAEHEVIHRKVAVKVMHAEYSKIPEVTTRFIREAQAASAIGHPNIVEIHDVGREEDGTVFIVMELLDGRSLKDIILEDGKLEPSFAVFVALQVLSALVAAHDLKIIHRDMKPDNIFITKDNQGRQEIKLLDFGIAKIQGDLEGDQGLTKTGTVLGTPSYMSPEQARGKDIDARIDIWAVGVILYEMLSGHLPYSGNSYNEIIGEILLETATPLKELEPNLPSGLLATVDKAMSKNRDHRFADATEMIRALMPFAGSFEDEMTDTSAAALKSSIAPPPYAEEKSTSKTLATKTRRTQKSAELPQTIMKEGKVSRTSRLAWFLLVIFLSALGYAGFIAYTEGTGSLEKKSTSLYEDTISNVETIFSFVKEQATPMAIPDETTLAKRPPGTQPTAAIKDASPVSNDAGLLADAGSSADASSQEAAPVDVTITFKGLPRKAWILLNEERVKPPVTLPRSDNKVVFTITAKRYIPLDKTIVPNADQTVEIDMVKKPRYRRRSRRKRRK